MASKSNKLLLPSDLTSEEALLGCLLVSPDQISVCKPFLHDGQAFFLGKHASVYKVLVYLFEKDGYKGIDAISVISELERRGETDIDPQFIFDLQARTGITLHAEMYARNIERAYLLRKLIDGAAEIAKLAHQNEGEYQDVYNQVQSLIYDLSPNVSGDHYAEYKQLVVTQTQEILSRIGKKRQSGVPMLVRAFDKNTSGMFPGEMITLAGRPGTGKSSFALSLAIKLTMFLGMKVLFFSLEMPKEQLAERAISLISKIDGTKLRRGNIQPEGATYLQSLVDFQERFNLSINDKASLTFEEFHNECMREKNRNGLDFIIIDYMQLMSVDPKTIREKGIRDRQSQVSYISKGIKELAKELKVPILNLAQLNRDLEKRRNKEPMLSDLRESGSIEQDSDVVLFLYSPENYDDETEFQNLIKVIMAKHRSAPTGSWPMYFSRQNFDYLELASPTPPRG